MRTDTPVQVKLADYTPYPFAIEHVDMHFALDPKATRVKTKLRVKRLAPGDMVLDGVALALNSLHIDGKAVPNDMVDITDETLTLKTVPDAFTLDIDVTIDPSANTVLSGLYISGGRFCTQCESIGFRRITYWPDRPDVMSRFTVRMDADKATYPILLSNGTPGEAGDLQGGRHFAVWDDPHLKPSYLFALCAGDYDVHRDSFTTMSGDHVDLAVHVDKGDADRAVWAMESLKASMKWDEDVFQREYDLGVFNIVAVRDFNFGAMENKGLNVFNSAYVLADEATATDADFEAIESIVGHEYFHNWTGNRITCRDWFQLCLKEGLTVFRDQEFSADMRSRPVQRIKDVIRLRARQFAEDAGPLAHPVRPDTYASIDNLYTATVYEKGAELIRMLKTLIGDDTFAKGMQLYFTRHDGEATTIETFYKCFEEASGKNLTHFRQWYSQPGTPTLELTHDYDSWAGEVHLKLKQINPAVPGIREPKPQVIPVAYAAFAEDGQKLTEAIFVLDGAEAEITIPAKSGPPLVSVNRGFSAPIRVKQDVTDEQRLALARIDDDPFNQWDVLQGLLKADMLAIAYDGKSAPSDDLIEAVATAVRTNETDPAFAALLTRLPDIGELFLEREPADPAALDKARKQVQSALAETLADDARRILDAPSPTPFNPGAEQAGIRALRTAMIALLAAKGGEDAGAPLGQLFQNAPNMTESLATLRALCTLGGAAKTDAVSAFEAKWSSNPLVMDKWFAVQAATGDASDVSRLIAHKDFDLGNPNRVRSVIAVFAMQNLAAFHAPDGSGHAVAADVIAQADQRNPALAARLLQSFEQWKKLAPKARASAKAALERLNKKGLSKNAADIVARALA